MKNTFASSSSAYYLVSISTIRGTFSSIIDGKSLSVVGLASGSTL